jgi:hypothetical protein
MARKPELNAASVSWVAANVNPFRNEHMLKDIAPKFPDGQANTIGAVYTGTTAFSGATATNGFIYLQPMNVATYTIGSIVYGNNAGLATDAPTNIANISALEADFIAPFTDTSRYSFRIVGGGIKVNYSGDITHGSGTLRAGWCPTNICTAAPSTFAYYADYISALTNETYSVRDGITVSMPFHDANREFKIARADHGTAFDGYYTPVVQFYGLSSSCVLSIQFVTYYEICVPAGSVPFPIAAPADATCALHTIVAYANASDRIVAGHSFKSFMKSLGAGAKKFFDYVLDHPSAVKAGLALL